MTQEILRGNKLIAEFMGGKPMGGYVNNISELDGYSFRNKNYKFTELKYHSSWDWLMPVIAKINKTWEYTNMNGDDFLPAERIIQVIRLALGNVDYMSTFQQVIKFIEWHNSKTAVAVTPNNTKPNSH